MKGQKGAYKQLDNTAILIRQHTLDAVREELPWELRRKQRGGNLLLRLLGVDYGGTRTANRARKKSQIIKVEEYFRSFMRVLFHHSTNYQECHLLSLAQMSLKMLLSA